MRPDEGCLCESEVDKIGVSGIKLPKRAENRLVRYPTKRAMYQFRSQLSSLLNQP